MAITISNVTNALQKVIMPYIQENFNKETVLLDQLKRNTGVTFMNDNFYAPVRTARHGGVTNLANDGNTLRSGKASIGQASVGVKILTGTFDISKLVLDATKTAKGAVENQLTFQASSLASDFAKSVNRQFYSDGLGVLAEVSSSAAAAVVVLAQAGTSAGTNDTRLLDTYGSVNGDLSATEYIFADMALSFGSVGTALGTVSSVGAAGSVTMSATLNALVAAGLAVYAVDGSGANGGTIEVQGARAALSSSTGTSTYAGLARSTQGWTPQLDTTSGALTLSAIESQYLAARKFAQMGDQYAIFMNKTLYKKYGDLLTAMRRVVNETQLLGGFSGLEFAAGGGKVGVFLDYDVPDGEVFIINLDSWTICQVGDLGWVESPDAGSLFRRPDAITYQATMAWFMNLLCRAPAANGRLIRKTA